MGHLLSFLIISPIALASLLFLLPEKQTRLLQVTAFIFSLVPFLLSIILYLNFQGNGADYQFVEKSMWISRYGINYYLGVDGISLFLVILTTLLVPIIVLSAWSGVDKSQRGYFFSLMALESGILGAFLSLDIFLFYIFWEAMLIPMFFLIGIWGSQERIYAAVKFLLYTVVGSVPMLVAILYLFAQHKLQFGAYSGSIEDLSRIILPHDNYFSAEGLVFLAFSLAFAVKVPMFPLHTWLPDAHVQAPTGGSVILAGVLLKLGAYGFMRFAIPLAPNAAAMFAPFFLGIGAVAVFYGACLAIAQDDIKKLVAYSSVSHMGYVVIGVFTLNVIGMTGALYQMLNHGVSTGMLFLLVGMLYERKHTKAIKAYSGLAKSIPLFSILTLIATFSSIALPGTNGFIGEFLILQGSFLVKPWVTAVAGTGVVLGAVYMLWLCQRILFGRPEDTRSEKMADINFREFVYCLPLVLLIFSMGLYPKTYFSKMEGAIQKLVSVQTDKSSIAQQE